MKKRTVQGALGPDHQLHRTGLRHGTARQSLSCGRATKDAQETLDAAWKAGIRYFDTAPLYGLGLSETRLNQFLRGKKRKDYVISTKVGRLLEVCPPDERTGIGKFFDTPSRKERFDYTYDGVMRSLEFSLERLGIDSIDIVFVHDVDVFTHKSEAARDAHVQTLMKRRLQGAGQAARREGDQGLRRRHQRMAGGRDADAQPATSTSSCWPAATRCWSRRRSGPSCRSARSAASASCWADPTIPAFSRPDPKPGACYNYDPAPKHILDRVAPHRGGVQGAQGEAAARRRCAFRCITRRW